MIHCSVALHRQLETTGKVEFLINTELVLQGHWNHKVSRLE